MDPWHRLLIRGIFVVIIGVAVFWSGVSLATRLHEDRKWVGIVLAILGAAIFLYSFRYFGHFIYLLTQTSW